MDRKNASVIVLQYLLLTHATQQTQIVTLSQFRSAVLVKLAASAVPAPMEGRGIVPADGVLERFEFSAGLFGVLPQREPRGSTLLAIDDLAVLDGHGE